MEPTIEKKHPIKFKEYGSNVHKLVEYLLTIEDKKKRTEMAHALVFLMKQVNPVMKNGEDNTQKLWDHLFYISAFKLDVDSPFPMPEPSLFEKKPQHVDYNSNPIKLRHYGRNMELLAVEIAKVEDAEARENGTIYLGRLMKSYYAIWNKDNADDKVIVDQVKLLSKGKLDLSLEKVKSENLLDVFIPTTPFSQPEKKEGKNWGKNKKRFHKNKNKDRRN